MAYTPVEGGSFRSAQLIRSKKARVRPGVPERIVTIPEVLMNPLLIQKLHSEVEEIALDLRNPEEYADVLEALVCLARRNGVTWENITDAFEAKRERSGDLNGNKLWVPGN